MLLNCTALCQNVIIAGNFGTDLNSDARSRNAFVACCTPMRMQINGEPERLATESCIRVIQRVLSDEWV
jgi:hypothetical protein